VSDLSDFKRIIHEPLERRFMDLTLERNRATRALAWIVEEHRVNEDVPSWHLANIAKTALADLGAAVSPADTTEGTG